MTVYGTGVTRRQGHDLKPYRYRGRPGWNPALRAQREHEADIAVTCPLCGAPPGANCHASGGRVYGDHETSHSARRQSAQAQNAIKQAADWTKADVQRLESERLRPSPPDRVVLTDLLNDLIGALATAYTTPPDSAR